MAFWDRPHYWGRNVKLTGLKGLCHVVSHADEWELQPLDVARRKADFAKKAGVSLVRGPHVTPTLLRQHGDRLRDLVQLIEARGMVSIPIIMADPGLARTDWREHCKEAAQVLPVQCLEIMNEPDNLPDFPPDRYAYWLEIAAKQIRQVNPRAFLVAPALGHGRAHAMKPYLKALPKEAYDVLSLHPYGKGWPYVKEALELVPDKPVWLTEDGDDGLLACAALRGSFKEYLAHPRIKAVFWYCLWDDSGHADYALLRRKKVVGHSVFSPKKTYGVFRNIRP